MTTTVVLSDSLHSDLLKKMFQSINILTDFIIDPLNDIDNPLFNSYNWLARELLNNYHLAIGSEKNHHYKWRFMLKLKIFPSKPLLGTIRINHGIMNNTHSTTYYYNTQTEFTFYFDSVLCRRLSDNSVNVLANKKYIAYVRGYTSHFTTITIPGGFYMSKIDF